jgi:lipoprotein-anchoring transpeptidase ErfK/SrfK
VPPLDAGLVTVLTAVALAAPPGAVETVGPAHASGVTVHGAPGGRVSVRLAARTPYGGRLRLWVRGRRDGWLKVAAEDAPGGAGWVRGRDVRPSAYRRFRIEIDRSARRLSVVGGGSRWSTSVVLGADATPTPLGTFQVTDRIDGTRYGGVYGARILVLSAYGDRTRTSRVAIHGVPPAAKSRSFSAGCVRVPQAALLRLFAQAPPGTPVHVRA